MGDVGGGFGQKAYLARDEQIVILAAITSGKPLKWIEDRQREPRRRHLLAAERAPSPWPPTPTAPSWVFRVDHLDEVGAYPQAGSAAGMGALIFTGPYRIPKLSFEHGVRVHQHLLACAVPRPVAVRDLLPRTSGRPPCRAGSASTRSKLRRRNVIHRDELPLHIAPWNPARRRVTGRDARAGAVDGRLRRVPRVAARATRCRTARRHRHRPLHRTTEHDRALRRRARAHPCAT